MISDSDLILGFLLIVHRKTFNFYTFQFLKLESLQKKKRIFVKQF